MARTAELRRRRFELMAAEHVKRLGESIRARREELGLTQEEVARAMPGRVNGARISLWERGENRPRDDSLEHLAEVLETTVIALTVPEPDRTEATPSPFDGGLDDRLQRMETKLTRLMEKQNGLLGSQSGILEEIRREQAALREQQEALTELVDRQIRAAREMEAAAEDLRKLAPSPRATRPGTD